MSGSPALHCKGALAGARKYTYGVGRSAVANTSAMHLGVHYEETVTDLETQVRQPIYQSAWGYWRHYDQHL